MNLVAILANRVLILALTAWGLAQIIKVPLHFLFSREWDWSLLLRVGGMPSSHASLVSAAAHAVGLYHGFDTPVFAVAVVLASVVVYDATGIRRQAGLHAEIINTMIHDLAHGHPLRGEQLREVLGHTPLEAIAGLLWGIAVAQIGWWLW